MDFSSSLTKSFSTSFTFPKTHNCHFISLSRCNLFSLPPPTFPLTALSVVSPLLHPCLECGLNSVASICTTSISGTSPKGVSKAIVLDVGGMNSSGCASSVKKILENHEHVYIARVDLTAESAIVWPVSKVKVVSNWEKQLGNELANHLTACGFKSKIQDEDTRHGCFKNTPHSDWPGHYFASLAPSDSDFESRDKEVDSLKIKVKDLLLDSTKELMDNIDFIISLCRLGVSYHFEEELEEQLDHMFTIVPKFVEDNDYDLTTVANFFRVLRQHGYNVTSDVFKKFQNSNGEFKIDIANNVKGILSLYEACFLAIPGEDILDEALAFTRKHLEVLAENSSPSLQRYIRHVLMFPCHRHIERLDTLHYIPYYEEHESANETLLKFAKLDFNRLQLLYRKELSVLSKWWIDTNVMERFPFIRDRLVESYFWAVGCVYEPPYSSSRMMLAKSVVMFTSVDDIDDTYGLSEDLQLFSDSLQLLKDPSDELPEYMKQVCRLYMDDFDNYNGLKGCSLEEGTKGNYYKSIYYKEMFKEIVRCHSEEAKWKRAGKAPSFDEYMKIANVTSGYEMFTSAFMLGAEDMGMKEILWLRNHPEMVIAAEYLGRLLNDLSGIADKKERQDFPKGEDCYMAQYGVSEDEAVEAIQKIVENKWRVLYEEMMKEKDVPKILLKHTLNYCRGTLLVNGVNDLYTYPGELKELVISMFLKPFPV